MRAIICMIALHPAADAQRRSGRDTQWHDGRDTQWHDASAVARANTVAGVPRVPGPGEKQ